MKLAAAYVRMSDDGQELSPEQQWAEIDARAARDGFTVSHTHRYEDKGRSGWKRRVRRPGFERLLRDLRGGRLGTAGVTRLYFWKSNRLARRRGTLIEVFSELEDAGVEAVSLTEAWPEDIKLRKCIQTLIALFDELYSDNLSEDVNRGMRSQASKGYWVHGRPPYGYVAVKANPDAPPRLQPDPEAWPGLQRLLQMRLDDGDGFRKIAERLTAERVSPPSRPDLARRRRPDVWRPKHVRSILGNLVYTGAIVWHPRDPKTGRPQVDDETGRKVVEVLCEWAHEALFSREQWLEDRRRCARSRRGGTKRNPVRMGERGVFTPWLRCATCGGRVGIRHGGSPKKRTYSYRCAASAENRQSCEGVAVRVDLLDPILLGSIEESVLTPDGAENLIPASVERLRAMPGGALADKRSDLAHEEQDLTDRISSLVRLAEVSEDIDELQGRLTELHSQRGRVREELAGLPTPAPIPDPDTVDIDAFRANIQQAWRGQPVLEQRKALRRILHSITLDPEGIVTIRYAWGDSSDTYGVQSPLGPPYAPMSLRLPSTSSMSGSPASMHGLPAPRVRSPASRSVNRGSASMLPSVPSQESVP